MSPEESVPHLIKRPAGAITLWVIYDHPLDFDGFVLRPQFSARKADDNKQFGRVTEDYGNAVVIISRLAWYGKSADELRAILPPGCTPIGPGPGDDRVIAEVWMDAVTT